MKRNCRYVPLAKRPLVLVLCQVRFSPVRMMGQYISAIQEELRRTGYPIEKIDKIQQLTFTPASGIVASETDRWEYRTKDEKRSVFIFQDNVVLQTRAYERFETFAEQLEQVVAIVLSKTEQSEFGVLQRVGLRYVNRVVPDEGRDFRYYIREGLHGLSGEAFQPRSHRLQLQSAGTMDVQGIPGTLAVRLQQNDQGIDLPPDLAAPDQPLSGRPGEVITLIDLDHYIQGNFDPDEKWITKHLYVMHDQIIDTFHDRVVTPEAIGAWR